MAQICAWIAVNPPANTIIATTGDPWKTDLEKAEGVGRLFEELGGKVDREVGEHSPATKKTAELLGFSVLTINELLQVHRLTIRYQVSAQ